jgi:hypothetical protein
LTPPDLSDLAREFAAEIAELLNGTITNGIRLSAVIAQHTNPATVPVGYQLRKDDLKPGAIPLTIGARPAFAEILVAYILELDEEAEYLSVAKSQVTLYLNETGTRQMLVHWDYDRRPSHEYPPAHIQVSGDAPHFGRLCELARTRLQKTCPDRPLRDLHFPVGGRRFRPSLEDIIEFLIVEGLVDHRPDSQTVIDQHRTVWEERQLKAAVRRFPEIAIEQLRLDGKI